jgi:putative transposase
MREKYPVERMCDWLSVSRSGYYDWVDRAPSPRAQETQKLDAAIQSVAQAERYRPGAPKIMERLRRAGHSVGRNRVAKRMRAVSIRSRVARKYKATTNSDHHLPVAPNLLQQNFSATAANQKWVSDITYIATDEGWLYLAVVMDLYARKVIGYAVSERMNTSLVVDALTMALFRRRRPRGVIVHSDRGSQYCAAEYQRLLNAYRLKPSMSKRGDCYDNAAMESWNRSFKTEAIYGERFSTRQQARAAVFEYIEVYYNQRRLHQALGYRSPNEFEAAKLA